MRTELVLQSLKAELVALALGLLVRPPVIDGREEREEAAHGIVEQHLNRAERPLLFELSAQFGIDNKPEYIIKQQRSQREHRHHKHSVQYLSNHRRFFL